MFCSKCGKENAENANYCDGCGNLLQQTNVQIEQQEMGNQFQNPDYVQVTEGYNPNYNKPKKSKAPFIILGGCATFFIIGIVAIVILVLSLAKPKEPITAEVFKSAMEQKGYTVLDDTEFYNTLNKNEDYDVLYTVKINDDEIQFVDFKSTQLAEKFYLTNTGKFDEDKEIASASSSYKGPNACKYSLSTPGSYKCISIIDDTGIYVDIDSKNSDAVKELMKELNY